MEANVCCKTRKCMPMRGLKELLYKARLKRLGLLTSRSRFQEKDWIKILISVEKPAVRL